MKASTGPVAKPVPLYLVSDSTGETVISVAHACLAQFPDVQVEEHLWNLVRTDRQVDMILQRIAARPGPVLFTILNKPLRQRLQDGCRTSMAPCIPVLDGTFDQLAAYFGVPSTAQPGRQHMMDEAYFKRIEAMDYAIAHDDGQALATLDQADLVLVGVSRTSKTPTCLYLANRGYRAANVPLVKDLDVPEQLKALRGPLVIGLTNDPERLSQLRTARVKMMGQHDNHDYIDVEQIKTEIIWARRLFTRMTWPVLDVSRKSIEETAAEVIRLLEIRKREAS